MAEELRNTLRDERARLGWTQAELAERVGVSRKTINTVENGVFVPSTVLALKLAAAIGKPVEGLFWLIE
ncbi:helix-turn-helix transcriptional regulator [Sphingomonas panacisoli]|uniref:Helix-turn-helix transcriptional regulator n=1 Tax=Sphingomonas panacisoli TaxID=1813879 RepID=A0A5B8LMW7_9SPHN|nr:helix-turn-helix transcriptional regulator [Sphingomonas panacisoli]QDZ08410.1 helix-turn-helix transcriptional regulator [Sphingomonas panacisoli]